MQRTKQTYWDSPEAKKLFLGNSNESRDVVEVLEERIERLQQANRSVNGWKDQVDKHDKDNLCSSFALPMMYLSFGKDVLYFA